MKKSLERLGVKLVGGPREVATPWAGVALLVDLFRKLEMDRILTHIPPSHELTIHLFWR